MIPRGGVNIDYYNQTVIHPLGIIFVVILGLFLFLLPRKKAIIPILIMACFIPQGQRLVIAGLDFKLLRILVMFGWIRIMLNNEITSIKINKLDIAVIIWVSVSTIIYTLQYQSLSAFVNRLGFIFDAVGMYFLFRALIKSKNDIDELIIGFAYISVPILFFFIMERLTGHNLFSILGGVPEITLIREGRLRVQGPFSHPILAGCFWASLLPLFLSILKNIGISRYIIITGILSSIIIIFLSASSTPVMSVLFGLIGLSLFKIRDKMKELQIIVVLGIIALDIVMKAPVYHLISRIDISGGSAGWHRYNLIHQALLHWNEWFFLGIKNITHWGVWANDVTNQYILEAISGGILTLLLFIYMIIVSFKQIGILLRKSKKKSELIFFFWAIGVSLFMHITNFLAVSYFGQIWILWYLILAIISSLVQSESIKNESTYLEDKSNLIL